MRKSFIYIIPLLLFVLLLSSCGNKPTGPTIHVTDPTMSVPVSDQSTQPTTVYDSDTTTELTEPDSTVPTETQSNPNSTTKMVFSSDPSNPFLNAVVERYGVNPSTLVAYYANSMDTNGNLVLEFDGSVGSDGRPIRTTKTLKNIYTVSPPPELLAKKATGTVQEGNEYTERESKYCQLFVEMVVFRFFSKDIQNA